MLFDGSSSGSESLLEEFEGSLVDLLDSHFEQLEDSFLEWRELSNSVHKFSDFSDSVGGSGLSVHWSLFGFELGDDESFVESEWIAEYAVIGGLRHGIYKFCIFIFC